MAFFPVLVRLFGQGDAGAEVGFEAIMGYRRPPSSILPMFGSNETSNESFRVRDQFYYFKLVIASQFSKKLFV